MKILRIKFKKKKQQGAKLTDQEQQYLRAAEQIFARQYGNVGSFNRADFRADTKSYKDMVKDMFTSPTGNKDFESYRKSVDEAQAFGVGNMSYPSNLRRSGQNPHFDSSMATEFDILLSMYQNLPESLKSSAAVSKQTQIEKIDKILKIIILNPQKIMFKNPFEPTIK